MLNGAGLDVGDAGEFLLAVSIVESLPLVAAFSAGWCACLLTAALLKRF